MEDRRLEDPGKLAKHYESHLAPNYELYAGYGDGELSTKKGSLFPAPPLNFSCKYFVSTFLMQFFCILAFGDWSSERVCVARVLDRVFDVSSLPEILAMANETGNEAVHPSQQQQTSASSEAYFVFSLKERWRIYREGLKSRTLGVAIICGFVVPLIALNLYYHHASSFSVARVLLSWCLILAFNGFCSAIAILNKFSHMEESFLAIEWTLAIKPTSFKRGLWWEVDLIALPNAWLIWTGLFGFMGLVANAFESSSSLPQPTKSIPLAIAMGIFGGCNMIHAIWVIATAGRQKKAMSDAWQRRAQRIRKGNDDLFACNFPDGDPASRPDEENVNKVGPERGDGKELGDEHEA